VYDISIRETALAHRSGKHQYQVLEKAKSALLSDVVASKHTV